MTAIVGVAKEGKVYLGGDTRGSNGWTGSQYSLPKVFTNGVCVMGYTSDYRMGQLLQYSFSPPKRHKEEDLMKYMITDFVEGIRTTLKSGGYASVESNVEKGGFFLVGIEGRLFRIESNYAVLEPARQFDAVGCGEDFALGCLYNNLDKDPKVRLKEALETAAEFSIGVSAPFDYVEI
jgi:ATP-dependent protease HslVU (ClpYQ) peptidase subunit